MHTLVIYDMIYLLTAIGLPPGGSCTIHIYTQTIHRSTQKKTINDTRQTINFIHNNFLKILSFYMFRTLLAHCQGVMMMDRSGPKHVEVYCF
jgi:hypothetical protein